MSSANIRDEETLSSKTSPGCFTAISFHGEHFQFYSRGHSVIQLGEQRSSPLAEHNKGSLYTSNNITFPGIKISLIPGQRLKPPRRHLLPRRQQRNGGGD